MMRLLLLVGVSTEIIVASYDYSVMTDGNRGCSALYPSVSFRIGVQRLPDPSAYNFRASTVER